MAVPRVFVSSTCYDLKDIRFQLRTFVEDFGFEPVMSEFGDIFYNYEKHVQDSCLDEIRRCQLFILIIGNNYGTTYFREKGSSETPDSVTLREFKKALEIDIYKHIYINKYVNYDYQNYTRALNKNMLKHFEENDIPDDKIDETKKIIKHEFDQKYHFAYDSYRYVFYFLDLIYELKKNNAIVPFESFDEIKENLKKQWAGFVYESIQGVSQVPIDIIKPVINKVENIEKKLNKLLESKSATKDKKISFDITSLVSDMNIENLSEIQNKIDNLINNLLKYNYHKRLNFKEKIEHEKIETWLNSLEEIIKKYKWSKHIDITVLFQDFVSFSYATQLTEIPFNIVLELYQLYSSLDKEDKKSFINTVTFEFNKFFEPGEEPKEEDELPF